MYDLVAVNITCLMFFMLVSKWVLCVIGFLTSKFDAILFLHRMVNFVGILCLLFHNFVLDMDYITIMMFNLKLLMIFLKENNDLVYTV